MARTFYRKLRAARRRTELAQLMKVHVIRERGVPREASTERLGGRGMLLVDALADTWETHSCPHGKSVSACFRVPGTPSRDR